MTLHTHILISIMDMQFSYLSKALTVPNKMIFPFYFNALPVLRLVFSIDKCGTPLPL